MISLTTYLNENNIAIHDWISLLPQIKSGKVPPPSNEELEYVLHQAPGIGFIIIQYYNEHNIHIPKDVIINTVKHNNALVSALPHSMFTDDFMLDVIKHQPTAIQFMIEMLGIDNIPENVLELAVKKQPMCIQYIKNPSEQLQIIAVSKNGIAIKRIPNYTQQTLTVALTESKFIKNEKEYNKFIKKVFKNNNLLMNKWLRYGENIRNQS